MRRINMMDCDESGIWVSTRALWWTGGGMSRGQRKIFLLLRRGLCRGPSVVQTCLLAAAQGTEAARVSVVNGAAGRQMWAESGGELGRLTILADFSDSLGCVITSGEGHGSVPGQNERIFPVKSVLSQQLTGSHARTEVGNKEFINNSLIRCRLARDLLQPLLRP